LDTTFNPGGPQPGTLTSTIDGTNVANRGFAVALQSDGKIVVAGDAITGGLKKNAVARFSLNGSLDITFNPAGPQPGTVSTTIDNANFTSSGLGVGIQSDGKAVVSGTALVGGVWTFSVARFNGDVPPVPQHVNPIAWLKTIYAERLGWIPGNCEVSAG
jgi:hypothetical protein